jgi:uncharacterized protein (DUF305 family)
MTLFSCAFVPKRVILLASIVSFMAPSFALAQDPTSTQSPRTRIADANEQQFLFENDLAMSNMSREMLVKPTGDVDRDFVAMMIPHHQGAIDMARAELKYGHNKNLRWLAQNIVTQQQHEILEMHGAVTEAAPPQAGQTLAPASNAASNAASPHAAIEPSYMK